MVSSITNQRYLNNPRRGDPPIFSLSNTPSKRFRTHAKISPNHLLTGAYVKFVRSFSCKIEQTKRTRLKMKQYYSYYYTCKVKISLSD